MTILIYLLLHFGQPMNNFLVGIRSYYQPLLDSRHASFQPIQLKDSTYILNPASLDDPNFTEIVDSLKKTPWRDSLIGHVMIMGNDTVILDSIKNTQFIQ